MVEATIISKDVDDRGNIRVWTQYKIDGVEVKSNYPKIDGKYVFTSRYQSLNFAGMDDAQIKARILEDVDKHTKSLIRNIFIAKSSQDIFDNNLKDVIGSTISNDTTTIKIDDTTKWIVKTDGTKVEKII